MMATSKKILEVQPSEMEMLLPWHAAGTLDARQARRVEEAIARDAALAQQFALIRQEYAETIILNETLGGPSVLVMHRLFAAIDAEPAGRSPAASRLSARLGGFLTSLSPRALAWSAGLGALLVLIQAGVIGTVLVRHETASWQSASQSTGETADRRTAEAAPPRALVRFAPDARVADVALLLHSYQAAIVDGGKAGVFRLQFGTQPMTRDDVLGLMSRLQHETIISLVMSIP